MAVYAIGDIQGCYDQLRQLLDKVHFDPTRDRLWLVGDLVNRGPKSLQTLRYIKDLGDSVVTVLGNHDLSLLGIAAGYVRKHRSDNIDDVLEAPDRDELLDWIRRQPLLHHDSALGYTMIHAGLPPQWDLDTARRLAAEVEAVLRGNEYESFLANMYGNQPDQWQESLSGWDRLRFITNCFTRLRYCDTRGRLHLKAKGPPGTQPAPYVPWFEVAGRASAPAHIVFGHWSALGDRGAPGVYPLDTGCLWGKQLTAMRLDGRPVKVSIHCPEGLPGAG
jgi:bis(5'-nucleosyl)-tetraphosphatase (symmetrical)